MSAITQRMITVGRFRFNMSEQTALDTLAAFYAAEVKSRHGTPTFDENTTANLQQLAAYITAEVPKFGLMLCGNCGNGKTTLMMAFRRAVNWLDAQHHFEFLDDRDYGYRFKPEMKIVDVRDILRTARDFDEFKTLRSARMLGIDDLGKEPAEIMDYGNIMSPVIELIEHRYANQLFTFITTNLTGKEIRAKYGDRIADRFNEMLHIIVFRDITYRK